MTPDTHKEWQPLFALGNNQLEKVFKTLKPKIVFDVGCNDGGYIETFLFLGAEKVIGFEPVPNMAAKSRERFHLDSRVEIRQLGITDQSLTLRNLNVFNAWSLAPQGSRLDITVEYKDKLPFDVEFVRLDDVVERPDFVKMDVDGYDFRALKSMSRIMTEVRPPILFEFSHLPKFILGDDMREMCEFIYAMKYAAVSMDGWQCPSAQEMMKYYPDGSSYDIFLMPMI